MSRKNIKPEDDRDIMILDLTRKELMIALDPKLTKKQKNLRIHRMQEARKRQGYSKGKTILR